MNDISSAPLEPYAPPPPVVFTSEQSGVIDTLVDHINDDEGQSDMTLEGPAGTGKSTCVQEMIRRVPHKRVAVTAPTNKATRVLREMLEASKPGGFCPPCLTIYSLLGVTMLANGELKHAAKIGDTYDLSDFDVVVVDEAGMLNENMLNHCFQAMIAYPHIKWVFMGDPYQIPPVNESISPVWKLPNKAVLTKVMRTDNQILTLATHIRGLVAADGGKLILKDDHDERGGVFVVDSLREALLADAEALRAGTSKAIAWKNDTVDRMNFTIRKRLLEHPDDAPWQTTERITLLERATDFQDEVIAHTDDEGEVVAAEILYHPIYRSILCWRLTIRNDDDWEYALWVVHDDGKKQYEGQLEALKQAAYKQHHLWKNFWLFKESFHNVRHAYATTCHRSQGSTYAKAYVDRRDILSNRRFVEALRCLYVGASRPRYELYIS